MILRLVISLYFLSSLSGTRLPELSVDKLTNIPADSTYCSSPTEVNRKIITILNHVKNIPYDIDIIIEELNSEIELESHGALVDNPFNSDSKRSIFQENINNVNKFESLSQCTTEIAKLAETAHKAYKDLKDSPACFALMLPQNPESIHPESYPQSELNVNMVIAEILKNVEQYKVPNIYHQNGKPIVSGYPINGKMILQPVIEDLHLPETQLIRASTPEPLVESIPSSPIVGMPNLKDELFLMPSLHPDVAHQGTNPILFGPHPPTQGLKYLIPEIFKYQPSQFPLYENNQPYQDEPFNPQIIVDPNAYHNPVHFKPDTIPDQPSPINDNQLPVITVHPIYVKNKPINSDQYTQPTVFSNILALVLELFKDRPSGKQIDDIVIIIKENQAHFNPKPYKLVLALLNSYRQGLIGNNIFSELIYLLLQLEANNLWSQENRDFIWNLIIPDETDQVDNKNLELFRQLIQLINEDPNVANRFIQLIPLLKSTGNRQNDRKLLRIILKLLNQNKTKSLKPEHVETILALLNLSIKGSLRSKNIDVADALTHWDENPYLKVKQIDVIFSLLKPNLEGVIDSRAVNIIYDILYAIENRILSTEDVNVILSFMRPDSFGNIVPKRLNLVRFVLENMSQAPMLRNILAELLNTEIVKSKYVDILLSLYKSKILNIQLLDSLITLLRQEKTGNTDKYVVNKLIVLLQPYKVKHPVLITDLINILNSPGNPYLTDLDGSTNLNPDDTQIQQYIPGNSGIHQHKGLPLWNGYKPREELNTNINLLDLLPILQKAVKTGQIGDLLQKYGFVELTYKLNQKPIIYQPQYYVKYKIPMTNLLTKANLLLSQNLQIGDPVKSLQYLIEKDHMSEVSPNLKGLHKEDILKLTVKEGDLVQAKLLDQKPLDLNEQISLAHTLNAGISPLDVLQQNNMNSAQYFSSIGRDMGGVSNVDTFNNGVSDNGLFSQTSDTDFNQHLPYSPP